MKIKNVKGPPGVEEAQRRARILERYNAIERPDADDDAAAAAELGMSIDRLIRLATAWRRYRRETLLVGQTAALAREGGAARQDVMAETIDLDLVRPEQRDEILRRIRIMQRHIAAAEVGQGDEVVAAQAIGVSTVRFRELLKNWRLHARPEALPGATRRSTPWRRQPDRARRQDLLRVALGNADPGTSLRSVYEAFRAACVVENIKPPSLPRFYGIVQTLRDALTDDR
ncbi:hypothetical protein [Sphingomonas sp. PvP018]|uniref:hypothetical protein n=1 Tax=Sphingomonas sp. PvP018 TaxID=2817852 RepID=UPI001AE5FA38|nr:hypothetical protein [Sphingomonas sp. PvP018]MBP2513766.1 hypothetical protein [Sphingomonas sp. PvP018]